MDANGLLSIQVLGPIRAVDGVGRDVTPDGLLQRRLFALLVLHRGRIVSADAAVDALWPGNPPRDPRAALHNHLSRLRRGLPDGVVSSVGDGYRLDPDLVDVDADRLAESLGGGWPSEAVADRLGTLLQRWQGPAYPELGDVDDGLVESARLEELRIRASEARAEARLALGETADVIAELTALTGIVPLRERPRSLLMEVLARTGRRVEAMRVYDDFRRLLGDELGIDPSPALAAQHVALLDGGPVSTPPLSVAQPAVWSPTSVLAVPPTSLLGRDTLLAEVTARAEAHRLVTLVGPAGVGKTRLLVEVGRLLLAARHNRPVVLCELAPADSGSVADTLAAALGIDGRPGISTIDRVVDVVEGQVLVILVDNCEHVIDAAAETLERILARCPGVRFVATSRERLRLPGEQVLPVPTLPVGQADPAVQLFVERAQAVAPHFTPGPAELEDVAEIVRRLDGLPLAIELAAARLHTHDLGEVAAGLDQRFALLSSGYRTSSRHASLGAAVTWSFRLLDERQQRNFADLSVFVGSFDAHDVAAVCEIDVVEATNAVAQLVERSLVLRAPEGRYVLLETLRAFGADQLVETGRDREVARHHALHQVRRVEHESRSMHESGRLVLVDIDAALPEMRGAFGWLLTEGEIDLAGRLVAGLIHYGFLRLRPDVLAWSERVIRADPDGVSPSAPRVWVAAAYASWMAGDMAEAVVRSDRALQLAEQSGGVCPPEVSLFKGNIELFEGRLDEAASWYRRSADDARNAADSERFLMAEACELLALGYAGDAAVSNRADELLDVGGATETPYAAYLWYCAGEADLAVDLERAGERHAEAVRLAELTHTTSVIGLSGASKASIDARL
ncbi:MAG TPA: BTAD domain-containing putative transcriptional regulator, partial [Ilumatobacter sp.]|nr:BTAD domain-containing putative transcriptional regulator [Ilumatobacter sp.]